VQRKSVRNGIERNTSAPDYADDVNVLDENINTIKKTNSVRN
jgi:hypothetical protein